MTRTVKNRLIKILLSLLILIVAVFIIIFNLRDNIVYFYTPTELERIDISEKKIMRVGGLVKKDSIKNDGSKNFSFVITDNTNEINVDFQGILPNLFAEEKGVVVEGSYVQENLFRANKVLAKHDENYMPPEVVNALKDDGKWQGQ
jgi:cytochrome c-type biogenesis protein CcmE